MTMEVDTTTTTSSSKHIKVHPLSILSISDHHTRITTGGSSLPLNSPTIGLLFGTQTPTSISIVDAEELDPSTAASSSALTKIELHRKVFPLHNVVGWYRVGEKDPTSLDLSRSRGEISKYCSAPLFLLMDPCTEDVKQYDIVDDDQLPLMVYETVEESGGGNNNAACFVNVNFELETFDPERIALEKVFRDAPKPAVVMKKKEDDDKMGNIGEDPQRKVKKCKKEETKSEIVSSEPKNKGEKVTPSKLDQGLDGLQCSIRAMNARMRILLEFLRRVDKGEVPRDDGLLKSVNGLIQQLPLVCAALEEGVASSLSDNVGNSRTPLRELENEYNDTMLLSYLAVVAKTAKSVHTYTEKYRSACEGSRRG
ncbi:hypothetical protein ACHAXN_012176 [Cyclotella atomus]|jgi:COP9 signalosome complex subunit 6